MSTPQVDLFELLDVSRREDSYSSVLCHLLDHSVGLRRQLLRHAFGDVAPVLVETDIRFRVALPDGSGVPDLLIVGHDAEEQRWELFIENKIDAGESPGQTQRYLDACWERVGPRAAGIYLTLDGHAPQVESGVVSLRHAELGRWIEASLSELSDPVLQITADAYVRRACAPSPQITVGDAIAGDLLKPPAGLLPRDAGIDALGRAVVAAAAPGWTATPIQIQGVGHGNPGLQFHREGWVGTRVSGGRFTRINHNVHGELELVWDGDWRLKVHFETEPYMTGRQLGAMEGLVEYEAMRDEFRRAVHERAVALPRWKMTNYPLQVCGFETGVGARSPVKEVIATLADALTVVGPIVDAALATAKAGSDST